MIDFQNILGLSHVFGETRSLSATRNFLTTNGFTFAFTGEFDVSPEKQKKLLGHSRSDSATMSYFTREDLPFGCEYLDHHGDSPKPISGRSMTISVLAPKDGILSDPDGNQITFAKGLLMPTSLRIPVFNAKMCGDFLATLGFIRKDGAYLYRHPLFQKLGVAIELEAIEDDGKATVMDEVGFNGISLLARNLDVLAHKLPLVGAQQIKIPGIQDKRRVMFFARDGILVEFLEISHAGK